MNFKLILTLGLIWSQSFFLNPAHAKNKVVIAVLDDGNKHQKEVVSTLRLLLTDCKTCVIKSFSLYKANGELTTNSYVTALMNAEKTADLMNISWNILSTEKTKDIETTLSKTAKSKLIFAAAGAPEGAHLRQPLSQTVMGKIKDAFIIGELNERGKLHNHSYEGPEMLTALASVEGKVGSSFSVLKMTAEVAKKISEGMSAETVRKKIQRCQSKNHSFTMDCLNP